MAQMTVIPQSFYQKGLILSLNPSAVLLGQAWQEGPSDPGKNEAYFLSPEFDFSKITKSIKAEKLCRVEAVQMKFLTGKCTPPVLSPWQADSEQYRQDFEILMTKIKTQNLIKAVPFMVFKTEKPKDFNSKVLPYILNKLIENSPMQFLYGKWNESQGFIGSTPEILFSGSRENLSLMALAATTKTSDNIDMSADPKLWDEHQFVIKDITEKLAEQKIFWQKTVEATYGSLKHLKTNGSIYGFQGDYLSLLTQLSPTAALGVFPKEELKNNSQPLHFEQRGAYGAPFGMVLDGFAHFVVCIRGLFWDETTLSIPVGGGIIEQSDYQTEFKELELKFQSTKAKLGL